MPRRLSSPAFIGRHEHLAALSGALARAELGTPNAVFLAGDAGIGKSRLVSEFAGRATTTGAQLLIGGCVDVGGDELPYAPLIGALRNLTSALGAQTVGQLAGAASLDLQRLVPEIAAGTGLERPDSQGALADPLAQSRLFQGLLGLLSRVASRTPVVLVVEDLHWADQSTKAFLSFLLRNARSERLLLVATYRSDELHRRHPLRLFLAELERLAAVERLELKPFERSELAHQLTAIRGEAPSPELLDSLLVRSQGNPFFAEELLAAADDNTTHGLPSSVRELVLMRVDRLSPATRAMVRHAAVIGGGTGHRLLEAVTGLQAGALAQALREAVEHNVLVPAGPDEGYSFRHALLREALYDELLPHERVSLHVEVARAIERDPSLAVGPHRAATQRATHWYAAHEQAAALEAYCQAATEDELIWAFSEAVAHLERALELWERVAAGQRPTGTSKIDLLSRAAEAAHLSGDNRRAMALVRSALDLLGDASDTEALGLAHARLGRYLLAEEGAAEQALAEYQAAASLVGERSARTRASILAGQAHILMLQGRALEARGPCEQAIELAQAGGDRATACDALNTLGAIMVILGAREHATELLSEAQRMAESLGALEQLRRAYINRAEALEQLGRLGDAADLTLAGWERLRGPLGASALFLAAEGGLRLTRLGRWQQADGLLHDALEQDHQTPFAGMTLAALTELKALRGETDEAEQYLRMARPLMPPHGDWPIVHARAAAVLQLARGDLTLSTRLLDPSQLSLHAGHAVFALPVLALALQAEAELAARAGLGAEVTVQEQARSRSLALLQQARALTGRETWPLADAPAPTLAELELCELEHRRALTVGDSVRWDALAERWQALERPYDSAYARLREAEARLADGHERDQIAQALGVARALAETIGAGPLVDQIDQVARRARVRVSDAAPSAASQERSGLTVRELEVLDLVAAGRTNREIGQMLYISPKTASVHVSRILAKLDARTRAEAVGAAYRLGLLEAHGRPQPPASDA
jgi:DNA-binding CsgD family transcriptional regulator/tetratricopeptide (TPR) repeat protein